MDRFSSTSYLQIVQLLVTTTLLSFRVQVLFLDHTEVLEKGCRFYIVYIHLNITYFDPTQVHFFTTPRSQTGS